MLKIMTDFNALKANENRWNLLKECVSTTIQKHTNSPGGIMMLSGNVTFKLIFYMETITLLAVTLASMYYEDHPEEQEGRFDKKDLVITLYENRDFLTFLASQLTLDLQGDWKERLQGTAYESVISELEKMEEENDT
jgi:hypothetical protein